MGTKVVSGAAGKMARLFPGGNEFCGEDWEITETGEETETTSTCSAGNKEQEIGNTQLNGTINYTWDITANPFDDPPNFNVGDKLLLSKLYIHATAGVGLQDGQFYLLTLHVLEHAVSLPVNGKVSGVITFKSHGAYTLPTGSDSSGA